MIYAVDGWSAKGVHKNVETQSRILSRWTIWLLSDVNPKILFQKCNLKLCIKILIKEINNLWWTFWTCFSNMIYFLSALTFSTLKPCFSSYLIYHQFWSIRTSYIHNFGLSDSLFFILVYLSVVNLHILIIREKIFNLLYTPLLTIYIKLCLSVIPVYSDYYLEEHFWQLFDHVLIIFCL